MENITQYIAPELLILVPVLYFIGSAAKVSVLIRDELIPLLLGVIGVLLSTTWLLSTAPVATAQDWAALAFAGLTQGILCAGASVYFNQLTKQHKQLRNEEEIRHAAEDDQTGG